jgi:7-keto-8-aminopelargonate synthetase-like enzyme/predicted MFS family arabinose efflux permease
MSCLFVTSYGQLVLARIAAAVGESGCKPPTYSLVGDYFPQPAERTRAMSVYWLGSPLSALISFVAGGALSQAYGWRVTFFLMGIPGLALAVLVKMTLVEPRAVLIRQRVSQRRQPSMLAVLGLLWRQRSCRHLSIALILIYTLSYGLGPWYAAFMMRSHGVGTAELGVWLGLIFSLGGVAGILLGGYVGGRWFAGSEKSQMRLSAATVALIAPCFVAFLTVPHKQQAFLALLPLVMVFSFFLGPTYALMQRLVADEMRATALAVVMLLANLIGMGVGPQVVGILSDLLAPRLASDSLRYAMLMMSFVAFWGAYHLWRVGATIAEDLSSVGREVPEGSTRYASETTTGDSLKTIESPVRAEILLDGRRYINFAGSSYLGLSGHPEIIAAGVTALRECGAGNAILRNHQVVTRAHQQVEAQGAAFFGSEAALYLAAGYLFGLVSLAVMRERIDVIFFDELAHFSLREAIAASGCRSYGYRHLDVEDLRQKIKENLAAGEKPLVITDGMYSTFGDIAPLHEIAKFLLSYDGRLLLDESHSFGVLGQSGRGACEHHDIPAALVLKGGSLGKAFGACGGIIPATREEVAAFRATPAARGAGSGSPGAAAMCAKSLSYVSCHPELLTRLRENTAYLKSGLRELGLDVRDTVAPVAGFVAGSKESMQTLKNRLMSEGIFMFHSTYIGAGASGAIRCGIFADHTRDHLDALLEALRRNL